MKILLLNDTSGHANWGCVATSAGLKSLIHNQWPAADFTASPAEKVPFRKLPVVRHYLERRISRAITEPDGTSRLTRALSLYGFDPSQLSESDVVIVNGEGMMHSRSGHLIRLLGILDLARHLGCRTAVINQTVDVDPLSDKAALLSAVYKGLDVVWVRDTDSLELLHRLGVAQARMVPDAAFAVAIPDRARVASVVAKLALPDRFVAMTGSSALSKRDGALFESVFCKVRATFDLPVIILASTKTDLKLAQALQDQYPAVRIVDSSVDYLDIVAILSAADALIGGRFHPTIFAALTGTPVLGFCGNTHKISGMLKMINYPVDEVTWKDSDMQDQALRRLLQEGPLLAEGLKTNAQRLAGEFSITNIFE